MAVDLHELEPGVWYLHIIDEATWFSAGSILSTKKGSEIVKHFVNDWISMQGPPQKPFTDNWGGFNNDKAKGYSRKLQHRNKDNSCVQPVEQWAYRVRQSNTD